MKLFLKEHQILIIVQLLQFTIIGLLIWLGGFRNLSLILYSVFLGLFFLVIFLLYKYNSQRKLYERLSEQMTTLDESQRELDYNHLSEALSHLLKSQYQLYEKEVIQLKQMQEEQFIFINRWIHQMKTPLSVLELTAQDLDEPESSNMREEIDRMKTGLHTVLHMARLRSFDRDFHVSNVNMKELIAEVNRENKRLYIRNNIYPRVTIEKDTVTAYTDEKWFYFILTQLIQNAVKYTADKSEIIDIRVIQKDERTIVEVEDYGVGIPEFDVKRIFEPFFTGEIGRRFRESTGVGLYLTKEVVDFLGHDIEVESIVDKGTVFRIIM